MPDFLVKTKKVKKLPGYLNMPIGGMILEAGNSVNYKTGEWRTKEFYINKEECSNCFLCYIYCPENCIKHKDGEVLEIQLDYCKGCGICAEECPKNAIKVKL